MPEKDDECLTPWDCQAKRIYDVGGVSPTLYAGENGNRSPSIVLKVRMGCGEFIKKDGSHGTSGRGPLLGEEVAFTVAATQDQTLFQAIPIYSEATPKVGDGADPAFTLRSRSTAGGINDMTAYQSEGQYVVRRLTPLECERLQGFPDNYTRIPWKGKPAEECPDGPRYKAIGNSMAVPVMRLIGERIEMVDKIIDEMEAQ